MKNETISPKYDEFELANILEDDNWKKLGACEIKCTKCIDYTPKTKTQAAIIVENTDRMNEVNTQLNSRKQALIKPKSEVELMKEQNEMLLKRLEALENIKPIEAKLEVSNEGREKLENKASELGLKFRNNIGSEKLLSKIQLKEPEFTI